ncbi:MAG: RNHCP domain-containing protein [Eubacteriales bacterium]|nr:RNHCP domain-containing protein [Eubacteriales bacterium]
MSNKRNYHCHFCGWMPSAAEPDGDWDHCPNCLASVHRADENGYACGGTLHPVSIWVKSDDSWEIIQRCSLCGAFHSSPMSKDDSPVKLLSLASKPLSMPPFPIEKMEQMTAMMGGQGDVRGYYYE